MSEADLRDICAAYDLEIGDLLPCFFLARSGDTCRFLHRSFAEFLCLFDRMVEDDDEVAAEAIAGFPFDRLRFSGLFAQEIKWLQLRKYAGRVRVLMDNYEVSLEDYQSVSATKTQDFTWYDYYAEKARVRFSDFRDYFFRLAETETIGIRFSGEYCPELLDIPVADRVKRLDIAHNGIEGAIDLSGFTRLETLDISGNPRLSLERSNLPASLRQIIRSEGVEALQKPTGIGGKLSGFVLSQNGNPAFGLPTTAFREPEMVRVEAGTFQMGSQDDEKDASADEKPRHPVKLSAFHIGKYPVTMEEFAHFVKETRYVTNAEMEGFAWVSYWNENTLSDFVKTGVNWRCDEYGAPLGAEQARHPVKYMSWHDASAYCAWLNKKTGKKYGLPTEAQWEYAAIGGHRCPVQDENGHFVRKFLYAGSDDPVEVAWHFEKFQGGPKKGFATREVGRLKPNELGLHDMSGNVWEWCRDRYDADYYDSCLSEGVKENPEGPEAGSDRVVRGGSWGNGAVSCRVASRNLSSADNRSNYTGFRLVFVPQSGG